MVKKILFKNMHWLWSVTVLGSLLIITGIYVFDSINQSKQANLESESATQYQNDLAANTFTEKEAEREDVQKETNNEGNEAQPIAVPVATAPTCDENAWDKLYTQYQKDTDDEYMRYKDRHKELIAARDFINKYSSGTSKILALAENTKQINANKTQYEETIDKLTTDFKKNSEDLNCKVEI